MPFFRDGTEEGRDLGTLPKTGERPGVIQPVYMPSAPSSLLPIDALKPIPGVIPLTTPPTALPGEKGTPLQEIGEIKPPSDLLSVSEAMQKTQEIYQKIQKNIGILSPTAETLTGKQIFDILWHPNYIAGLRNLESVEIRNGEIIGFVSTSTPPSNELLASTPEISAPEINWHIPPSERSSFQTDADVLKSLKNLLVIFHQNKWVSDKDFGIMQDALNDHLPRQIEQERRALGSGLPQSRILPGQQQIIVGGNPMVLSSSILSGLKFVLQEADPANAFWYTGLPDCYKDDIPVYPIPGHSIPMFFCNSAIEFHWAKKSGSWFCRPSFELDCGQLGLECWIGVCAPPIELGCLNSPIACRAWPNAIWDAPYALPPQTLMCGCG